jgi:hypothetical protein
VMFGVDASALAVYEANVQLVLYCALCLSSLTVAHTFRRAYRQHVHFSLSNRGCRFLPVSGARSLLAYITVP